MRRTIKPKGKRVIFKAQKISDIRTIRYVDLLTPSQASAHFKIPEKEVKLAANRASIQTVQVDVNSPRFLVYQSASAWAEHYKKGGG